MASVTSCRSLRARAHRLYVDNGPWDDCCYASLSHRLISYIMISWRLHQARLHGELLQVVFLVARLLWRDPWLKMSMSFAAYASTGPIHQTIFIYSCGPATSVRNTEWTT